MVSAMGKEIRKDIGKNGILKGREERREMAGWRN